MNIHGQALDNFITLLIMAFCVNRVRGLEFYLFDTLIAAAEHELENISQKRALAFSPKT